MNIEDYLYELCAALNVDPLRRDEIRLEVHTHLRQRADEWIASGLNDEAAEQRAVQEFGEAEDVAARLNASRPAFSRFTPARHVDFASVLLISGGIGGLFSFVGMLSQPGYMDVQLQDLRRNLQLHGFSGYWVTALDHQVWLRSLLYSGAFPLAKLTLGMALLYHRKWARIPVLTLGLIHVSYLLFFLFTMPPLSNGPVIAYMNVLSQILLILYVVWAVVLPGNRKHVWV